MGSRFALDHEHDVIIYILFKASWSRMYVHVHFDPRNVT